MKKLAILLFTAFCFITANAETLSAVENNGSWVYLYNSQGRKFKSLSASSVGVVMGYSSTFFVSRNGGWIYIFDADGRKLRSMSASTVGDVLGVAGDTFTSKKSGWVYTWSKDGRKINSRYVGN